MPRISRIWSMAKKITSNKGGAKKKQTNWINYFKVLITNQKADRKKRIFYYKVATSPKPGYRWFRTIILRLNSTLHRSFKLLILQRFSPLEGLFFEKGGLFFNRLLMCIIILLYKLYCFSYSWTVYGENSVFWKSWILSYFTQSIFIIQNIEWGKSFRSKKQNLISHLYQLFLY